MDMSRTQKWLLTGAATLGLAVGAAGIAGAATSGSSPSTSSTAATAPAANAQDPASMPNHPNETALTGDTAAKVKAAAEAAVPGGTVLRVENDADGSAYEAHVSKADGSLVTVKIDSSFNVTDTITGGGGNCPRGGPGGPGGRDGPSGSSGSSGSSGNATE
jgi:hypothetical protein